MKKLLSLMCSLLMIVTLCGCSSTQDQQEEVTLTFAAAASLENTFEDKLIPEFEKENPNIKVQGVYDSSGKLQIQIEHRRTLRLAKLAYYWGWNWGFELVRFAACNGAILT